MISGIGTDLVDIRRIEKLINRFGEAFVGRVFTPAEQDARPSHNHVAHYAKRFAAKEAVFKALGTGLREGMRWHDIMIDRDALGKPEVRVCGTVAAILEAKVGAYKIDLALADEYPYAQAFVVISSGV